MAPDRAHTPRTLKALTAALDALDEPALLLAADLRVVHANPPARGLLSAEARWRSRWREPATRDVCLAPVLLGRPCAGDAACTGCELSRTLRGHLERGTSAGPLPIEYTIAVDGHATTQRLQVTGEPLRIEGAAGLLLHLLPAGTHPPQPHAGDTDKRTSGIPVR